MDDLTAVFLIKQGDLNGLEILVTRYQVQAVHAAYLIVQDRAQAEEVAQVAFVKAVEKIHQFDDRRPFAPWFFRIVINDALKVVKKQKRNIPLDQATPEDANILAEWIIDPGPTPEQILEEKQIRENILNAIRSLPPEQRAVIVMRYFLDLSEADMTVRMDRPLSTVKWWLRDARQRLRDVLRPSNDFGDDGKE